MPAAGGAIQFAILPGSVTGCIRLRTYSRSAIVGSHSVFATFKLFARDQIAFQIKSVSGVLSDMPVETRVREIQTFARAFVGEHFVPARQTFFTVFDVFAAQHFVQSISQRHFARFQLTIFDD